MGWECSGVVGFDLGPLLQGQTRIDLGPLLQGQTRIAKAKSAYNSLIIDSTGLGW